MPVVVHAVCDPAYWIALCGELAEHTAPIYVTDLALLISSEPFINIIHDICHGQRFTDRPDISALDADEWPPHWSWQRQITYLARESDYLKSLPERDYQPAMAVRREAAPS